MFFKTDETNNTKFRRYATAVSAAVMMAAMLTGCGQTVSTVAANTDAVRQQNADLPEVVINGSRSPGLAHDLRHN